MGFLDDFETRIGQAGDVLTKRLNTDIDSYLNDRLVEDVVSIARPRTGNLSADQIKNGERGEPPPMAGPASAMRVASIGILPIIGIGIFIYFLVSKKRRG